MTEQEYKDYYADLLILQYKTQQKARATIGALVASSPACSSTLGKVKYIVVGSPTISGGIVSGMNKSNYLVLDTDIDTGEVNTLEVQINFTTGSAFNHTFEGIVGTACGTFSFYLSNDGVLHGVYLDDQGTHDNPIASGILPNTEYWAKMLLTSDYAILSISQDGEHWTDTIYSEDDQHTISGQYFLFGTYPFSGSLNLNNTYIKINDKSWFGYSLVPANLPEMVINGYDLETAEGSALDVLGKYVGLKRQAKALIGNTQTNVLNDEQYRTLLKLKLIKNTNFSSTSQLRTALYNMFPTSIRLYDNRDMTYTYQLSNFWSDLLDIVVTEELLPVPMALGYTATIVPDLLELYGFSDYGGLNDNPNGYSDYTNGFKGRWLSYKDKFAGD